MYKPFSSYIFIINVHTFLQVYIHAHTFLQVYIHVHTFLQVSIHVQTFLQVYISVQTFLKLYIHYSCTHLSPCIYSALHIPFSFSWEKSFLTISSEFINTILFLIILVFNTILFLIILVY